MDKRFRASLLNQSPFVLRNCTEIQPDDNYTPNAKAHCDESVSNGSIEPNIYNVTRLYN
jgi:hypothetical protein